MPKPLTVWITKTKQNKTKQNKTKQKTTTVENSSREENTRPPDLPLEIAVFLKKYRMQQLELNMGQQTAYRSGKEYVRSVYCHPAYLTYMQSTS